MKTISVPVSTGRPRRKAETTRPTAKVQRSGRTSKRLAAKAEQKREEERLSDEEEQEAADSAKACDPSLTEVQAPTIPPSKLHTASNLDSENMETAKEAVLTSKQSPEGPSTDVAMVSEPAVETVVPQSPSQENTEQAVDGDMAKQEPAEAGPSAPPTPTNTDPCPAATTPATRHHDTGALMVSKTAYVIPKKPSGSQSPSGHAAASTSSQKPSSAPTPATETRNLPVSPAPSAPSSRPSQPNNLVRQSIQRSLTGILFKRVCDCEDLEMSESEAAKLVASIEMEMFNIFRNTDSKYMNKYRTIMFNLKDPRNKGLLYRVVRGEIGPFRLVRMSQKDMQAVKAPEPSPKETAEASTLKGGGLQKPEAVKIDLPALNPGRPNKKPETMEQKKSVPPPTLKTKARQPSQTTAVPDILSCMLKDTTSEHKAHLFDLKCKICTGQMLAVEEEEPKKKKTKVSVSRDKRQSPWRRSAGNDSPLRAPPDSPDRTSSSSFFMESSSNLVIDSPVLTIVESPASPLMDSPASPTLDSPASPIMDSPASPVQDSVNSTALKRGYTPVVIPTVSTVSITRRDPRTAANRFSPSPSASASGSSDTAPRPANPQVFKRDSAASQAAPAPPRPPTKALPKSILMKPSSTVDPRLFGASSRTVISQSPAEETVQFLAKQDILWKGFLNMLTVAKFVTKGYLVSGSPENLKADLPDTIQIGGRILPQTVWDYVTKLKTSLTKELCVIRFQPATEEEEVAYVSLFSYFSSRGRFGVVANGSRSIKDFYLVPLSAKEAIPSILQPLEGPGLETSRPNLLLGLAVVQRTKRPGSLPQEIEEKRPKVQMSKDPAWIPKPPVLYGSDKLEIFQPYDPETPTSTTPPLGSPSCPGSPSDSSSSSSAPTPALLTSTKSAPPVSTSANVIATQSSSSSASDNNPSTTSSEKKALHSILKTLFRSDATTPSDVHVTKPPAGAQKILVSSDVSRSMMDPIVQQYGHKSKAKTIEEEENEFDRPYDPEEEYDPAMGYKTVVPQTLDKAEADDAMLSDIVEDDVAYDPEDETIFQEIQSDTPATKPPVPIEKLDSPSCPTPVSNSTSAQTSVPTTIASNLPTGTVVVSAATLSEQQRMLEELNKQIEEQKRQLKEQEEALRQQRETVGMFMAHFSVSDSLMSPPGKPLPLNKLPALQSSIKQTDLKPPESTDKETSDICDVDSATDDHDVKIETNAIGVVEHDTSQENAEDSSKSAGEIEDSDVAYDPEDESLFDEIQEDVFKGSDSVSRPDHSGSNKGKSPSSSHSRKHRSSPKKRSRHDRERHRSPSRHSQQRSPSHSRRHRERDRHRKSERDRSRHRGRDHSERQGHHRKGHSTRRHSHGQRRSSSSSRKRHSLSPSPKQCSEPFSEVLETSELASVSCNAVDSVAVARNTSSSFSVFSKNDFGQSKLKSDLVQDQTSSDCSQKQLHNIKLVISEPLKCPSPQKQLVTTETATGEDAARALSSQVEKSSQQDNPLYSKIATTVPLREIDPPIRDSPESPDPEPQFVKPSHTVELDCVMNEENKDCVDHSSLSNGGYTTDSNQICTSSKDVEYQTNDKRLDFSFLLNLQNPSARDQGVTEPDKQMTTESPSLRHTDENCQNPGGEIRQEFGTGISNSLGAESSLNNDSEDPSMMGLSTNRFGNVDLRSGSHLSEIGNLNIDARQSSKVDEKNQQVPKDERLCKERHTDTIDAGTSLYCKTDAPNMFCDRQEVLHPNVGAQRSAHPNCKGSRIAVASPDMKNQSLIGPLSRDLNWNGSESDMRKDWRGLDHSKSDPGRKGASIKDNWKIHQTDREGANTQKQMIDVIVNCQEFGQSGPEMRDSNMPPSRHTNRGLEAVSFLGPRPENIELNNNVPVHDRRGLVPPFIGSNETGPTMDIQRPDLRVKGPPDFVRPEPERTDLAVEGPGSHSRGHPGPQFQRSTPDRGGPALESQIPNMRGSDVRGLWPERRSPGFVGPGPHQRGPLGLRPESTGPTLDALWSDRQNVDAPEFMIPGPESTNLRVQDRGLEGTRPAGPDLSESIQRGHEVGVHRVEGRTFVAPDFRRPRNERRNQTIEAIGPGVIGPGCPELSLSGPQNSGLYRDDAGSDQTKPGSQDFRGQQPENRDFSMDGPRPNRRGPGGPEFREPQLENRGLFMEGPRPDRRGPGDPEFRLTGPDNRDMLMDPLLNRKGPGGPQFRGPPPENMDSSMEVSWPEHREPEIPDFRGPGPDNRGLPTEGPRPDRRADFRGPGPDNRGLSMDGPRPDRRGPRGLEFRGPGPENRDLSMHGPERRRHGSTRFMGPQLENRGVSMDGSGHDKRGHGGPEFRCPGPDDRGLSMIGPEDDHRGPRGPDFKGPWPDNRGFTMDRHHDPDGPHERGSGGPDFRGLCPKNRDAFIAGPGPDRKRPGGADFGDPEFDGRGPAGGMRCEKRLSGGPDCIEPEPQWRGPVTDPTRHREPNFRARGRGGRGSFMESSGPVRRGPGGPDFSQQMAHERDPVMGGPRPDRRAPGGFSWSEHEQRPMDLEFKGPGFQRRPPPIDGSVPKRRAPCEQNYHGQDFDFGREVPDAEGLHSNRRETEDYNLQESGPKNIGPHFEGPEPEWERSHVPDFRKPGIRPRPPHTEVSRHDNREDWGGSELTDEDSNREGPGFEGTGQRFRGPSPVRRNVGGHRLNMQELADETRFSEDNWKEHCNRPFNEQGQEHSWQGPFCERRGRGGRGQSLRRENPMRPFPRPRVDALDEWNDPGDLVSGPDQNDPHMLPSGPRINRPDKWRQPDHGNSRHFFPDSDDHGEDSNPGLSSQDNSHVEYDEQQPAIRGRFRAPRGKRPGPYIRGPDNPYHSRREFNMESCDRRGPGGPRFPGPGNRNFSLENHVTNEGLEMENPGPGTQRFEHNLRQERRGPKIRGFGSKRTDMRGPNEFEFDRCSDTVASDVMGPVCSSRGPHAKHRELEHRGPHQAVRYQDPSLVNRPASPHPNSGGNFFPGKPPRHRGALLPTPTEGLIRFPNQMNKNADAFNMKQNIKGHPVDRQQSRTVSQEKEQITAQKEESPTLSTPAGEKTAEGPIKEQHDGIDNSVEIKTT